ncbi:hypothetical protein GGF44_003327, partial [Coemansia sp. RSA 1694]
MSKTKFPHPSAPTIARTSPSSSGSRISAEAECSRTERGLSRSPPPLPLPPPSTAQGAYSGKEAKRQSPAKKPPGLGSAAPRGGPRKAGKLPAIAAVAADNRLSDGDAVREVPLGSFPVKPRGGKGGRRGPGGQVVDLGLEVASNALGESAAVAAAAVAATAAAEATRSGSTGGPRPVFCICRRPAIPGETTMLACTECKESFHRSCVGVPSNSIHDVAAPYVCSACLKQHPRRRRAPGTILGVGSKVAPAAGAPKRSKKTPDVATVDPIAMAEPMPGKDSSTNSMALPTANQAALAAFMNLAGAMDEDDICPICEDECTCRGGEQTAGAGGGGGGEHAGDGGAPMPLFSQISRHTADSSMDAVLAPTAATKRGGGVRAGKRPAATKAEGGVAKARAAKTKAAATKPRAKKGKNSEKSAISRLVGAMDSTAPAGKDDEDEEDEGEDSDEDESVFVSGRGGGSHWQVGDKPVARQAGLSAAVAAASGAPAPRAKTT